MNVVSPGFIEVGLRPGVSVPYRERIKHDIPLGHFGEPSDIANAVAYLVGPDGGWVNGQVLLPDINYIPRSKY